MSLRLSVVIQSYRRTEYLDQALESVINQESSSDFEVILVSASPTYVPADALSRMAEDRGVSIRRVQTGDVPVGQGLSEAIALARGDVLAIIDDDDKWVPGKVRALETAFANDSRLVYLHNGQVFTDQDGRDLAPWSLHRTLRHRSSLVPEGKFLTSDTREIRGLRELQKFEPDFNNSSIAIRKSTLAAKSFWLRQVTGGEDTFLFFCALADRGNISASSDRLTRYRIHKSTLTSYPPLVTAAQRLDSLRGYADRHLLQTRLAREVISPSLPSPSNLFLERDQTYWDLISLVLTGRRNAEGATTGIRRLLESDGLNRRTRELGAVLFVGATMLSPPTGRSLLAAWRMAW
jgi:glycosyltransferase involved in cell wall biosynthesis